MKLPIREHLRAATRPADFLSEIAFIPLFWASWLTYVLYRNSNFDLTHFTDALSAATANGIDIGLRIRTFYEAFGIFLLLSIFFYLLTALVRPFVSKVTVRMLNATGAAGTVMLALQVLGGVHLPLIHLLLAVQAGLVAYGIVQLFLAPHSIPADTESKWIGWLGLYACATYFLIQGIPYLQGTLRSFPVTIGIFLITALILLVFRRRKMRSEDDVRAMTFRLEAARPFVMIPAIGTLSVEAAMIAGQRGLAITPAAFFLSGVVITALLIMRNLRRAPYAGPRELLSSFGLPWMVAGFALAYFHQPVVGASIDFFEDANRFLPLQQWHEFGRIPFLDTFSSHALSDFFWGWLYNVLNGYHPLGGGVYLFLLNVMMSLAWYYFLKQVTNESWLAFWLAVFFPLTDALLPTYFHFVPLLALAVISAHQNSSVRNFFLLFTCMIFLVFWRIDLGLAGITTVLFLSVWLLIMSENKKSFLTNAGYGALYSLIPWVALFIAGLLLRGGEVFRSISTALAYLAQLQSYGRTLLFDTASYHSLLHYFILPVAVLAAGIAAMHESARRKANPALAVAIVFFSVFYFMNFQRGLVRHTLAEGWDTALTSYAFFVLSGTYLLHVQKITTRVFFDFSIWTVLLVMSVKFGMAGGLNGSVYSRWIEKQGTKETHADPKNERVLLPQRFEDEHYADLAAFLHTHFPDTATFYDFTNTPMLYAFLHRELPGYLCQPPHTAHNLKLQDQTIADLKKYNPPVVFFRHTTDNFWDRLDGIANTYRHYRIAEFIYGNYRPYTALNGISVWVKKDVKISPVETRTIYSKWNLYGMNIVEGYAADSFHIQPSGMHPQLLLATGPSIVTDASRHRMVRFRFFSDAPGTCSAAFQSEGEWSPIPGAKWNAGYGMNDAYFPVPDTLQAIDRIRIDLPKARIRFHSFELLEAPLLPDPFSSMAREEELKAIPYYSGMNTGGMESLQTILNNGFKLENEKEHRWPVGRKGHSEKGEFIVIRIHNPGGNRAAVVMNYGEGDRKLGGFVYDVKPGEAEYAIRVSTQYNWTSGNPDWLSLYAMGGDLEIRSIEHKIGD